MKTIFNTPLLLATCTVLAVGCDSKRRGGSSSKDSEISDDAPTQALLKDITKSVLSGDGKEYTIISELGAAPYLVESDVDRKFEYSEIELTSDEVASGFTRNYAFTVTSTGRRRVNRGANGSFGFDSIFTLTQWSENTPVSVIAKANVFKANDGYIIRWKDHHLRQRPSLYQIRRALGASWKDLLNVDEVKVCQIAQDYFDAFQFAKEGSNFYAGGYKGEYSVEQTIYINEFRGSSIKVEFVSNRKLSALDKINGCTYRGRISAGYSAYNRTGKLNNNKFVWGDWKYFQDATLYDVEKHNGKYRMRMENESDDDECWVGLETFAPASPKDKDYSARMIYLGGGGVIGSDDGIRDLCHAEPVKHWDFDIESILKTQNWRPTKLPRALPEFIKTFP